MSEPLRAFLLIRRDGNWSVSVHKELGSIRSEFDEAGNKCNFVLHVGFNRPPAASFDLVVNGHEGRVVVTGSAKYSLPSAYASSELSIGDVDGLPVYLGIGGWGYTVADDDLPKPAVIAPIVRPFTGWVATLLAEEPDLNDELAIAGVFGEETYLQYEAGLRSETRRRIAIYRVNHLLGRDREDPCALARAFPPWLIDRSFAYIPTTVRVENVFNTIGIATVRELGEQQIFDLLRTQNFGRKSSRDLLEALWNALSSSPIDLEQFEADVEVAVHHSTLLQSLVNTLQTYPARDRDIVQKRMGLGQKSLTLQELGEQYGITRERVRQIEARSIQRLIKEEVWDDTLSAKLSGLMTERRIPLPLIGIEAADPWFAGTADESNALEYLLENVSASPARVIKIEGVAYIGALRQIDWEQIVNSAKIALASAASERLSLGAFRLTISALLPASAKEFTDLLWDTIVDAAHVAGEGDEAIIVSVGRGANSVVETVLEESELPLHYSEILPLAEKKAGKTFDIRRVHIAAGEVGFLLGRGIFGVERHLKLSSGEKQALIEEAEQVVLDGPHGRQWHTAEIVGELLERGVAIDATTGKYALDFVLRKSEVLSRLGRLVWKSADALDDDANRIDIRQAIIATLIENNGPMRTADIRDKVIRLRGVDKLFQLYVEDPLIRVDAGVWGLNDRDVPIKRPEQERFFSNLALLLDKRGRGIHYTELENSPTLAAWGLRPAGFLSLATLNPALKVGVGRYLYLTEWGGPRRESLSEALSSLLKDTSPVSLDEIIQQLTRRLEREPDRLAVSRCLQSVGATFHDGKWSIVRDVEGLDQFSV